MKEKTGGKKKKSKEPFLKSLSFIIGGLEGKCILQGEKRICCWSNSHAKPPSIIPVFAFSSLLHLHCFFSSSFCLLIFSLSLFLTSSVPICLSLPFSFLWSLCGVAAFYDVSKWQKKKLGEVQQPGVVGVSPELCYLFFFFSILKAWQARFQHFHTCPAKGKERGA